MRAGVDRTSAGKLDPYRTLKVGRGASAREVRASFKSLMIESHPDKNPGRRAWAERRVRELIAAYEVLSDPAQRATFDRESASRGARGGPDPSAQKFTEPFYFRKSDPESKALVVLHHFLHGKPRVGAKLLRDLEARNGRGFLATYLDREDYLDCLYLIGEYHASQRQYLKAAERFLALYTHEKTSRFPRHYLDEVVRLLKDLYLRKIPKHSASEAALEGLKTAGGLRLTQAEERLRLKRMAELLYRNGDLPGARRVVERARALFPLSKDMDGIRKNIERAG